MKRYLLGIDIGTSGTKTALFDTAGKTVASHTAEYPLYQPQNGWAEQDPEDWWKASAEGLRAVTAGIDAAEIAGIGLSGQMHGLVLLDKNDAVLRRSIIWCDQRTAAECAEITETVGRERLIALTANPALTGFTASKIKWVQNHEPAIWEKTAHILLPKDYIRFRLTGEYATEVSDAGGMQLLDIRGRRWSKEMLAALHIDEKQLAEVYESPAISGCVHAEAAAQTGLKPGTPVVGGAGDQAAGAVGNGIVRAGAASCSLGTSGVVFAATGEPLIDPAGRVHTFCHAVPGTWHVMGVAQASGLSLKWLRDNFCNDIVQTASLMDCDPYQLMDKMAARVPAGSNRLLYLPYLMGERTPHLDADCRGVFFGLSAVHGRAEMIRAVMEGVAFSQTDCLSIIRELGVQIDFVRASGGGGRSPLWRQMLSDCFVTPVRTPSVSEGPALGVAILAGVGTGVYAGVPEACDALISDTEIRYPQQQSVEVYADYYALYKRLYQSLRGDFKTLAGLR